MIEHEFRIFYNRRDYRYKIHLNFRINKGDVIPIDLFGDMEPESSLATESEIDDFLEYEVRQLIFIADYCHIDSHNKIDVYLREDSK